MHGLFGASKVWKNDRLIKCFKNENLYAVLGSAIAAFLFLFEAPVNIWKSADVFTDAGVFKTVAMMMERGYMPYRDSFDHKGPVLYILNYFGNIIGGYRGIWVIELIFMLVSILMIYKIARLSIGVVQSVVVTGASMTLLFSYFEGGNFTEEYAIGFIAVSQYIFLDYLLNEKITKLRLVICGASLSAVLLLRPNMIAVWIVFALAVLYKVIKENKISDLIYFLTWFIIGIFLIMLPILVWLIYNNSLEWCWKVYIEFNTMYVSEEGGLSLFKTRWTTFLFFMDTTIFLIATIVQVYICCKKREWVDVAYLAYMGLSLFFICLSGLLCGHYGMVLVPVVAYPISQLFKLIKDISDKSVAEIMSLLVSLYFLGVLILPNWLYLGSTIPSVYDARMEDQRSDVVKQIAYIIQENTAEEDVISVYGNWGMIYVASDRMHATRYSYQFPIGEVMPEIMDDYFEGLESELPKIIVTQVMYHDDRMNEFLDSNGYSLCWSEKGVAAVFVR